MITQEKAIRYNTGKLRYELLPTKPIERVVDVYTRGAHKYSLYTLDKDSKDVIKGQDIPFEEVGKYVKVYDGANNWRLGMSWMQCIAATERHIAKWKMGEDYDKEIGTHHLANAVWGLLAVLEFTDTHPKLDDRIKSAIVT